MRSLSERLKKRRRSQAGFTLVELLVVLVILGLLLGIVGPRAIDFLSRAKGDVAKIQIQNFGAALDLYRLDVGTYPTTEQGLTALMKAPGGAARWNGPYLKGEAAPLDPWNKPYVYERPGPAGKPYLILSLGADGQKGGSGDDADVSN